MSNLDQLPKNFIETFSRHIKYVKFIGIDIFDESRSHFLKRFGTLIIFYIMLVSTVFGQFLYIFLANTKGASVLDIINAIPGTLMASQDIVKISIIAAKRNGIRDIILEIAELWPTDYDDEKFKILNIWTSRLRIFQRFFYICGYVALSFYLVVPLSVTAYSYAVEGETIYRFPLDTVLQKDLEKLKSFDGQGSDDCSDIKVIVKSHQKILRVVENINNIFGPLLFAQVTFSSIVICCFGFLTIVGIPITLAFNDIAEAAYNCVWYKRSNKFRKFIQIIIARAQEPCMLSALGFSNVTLATLSKILSTSWSYLSLLNQMYKDTDMS
ncbi:putative odorant receptor 85d [Zerene cesonia]|uniref:putative odorant receptor 85d n=1 Tax=Zerene cesonia TaxID=33412 RepID=UPI0018E4FE89|nr:putative odorant receptor 85d [Zerene cesonia]